MFLLFFLSLYGGMHLYGFIKIKRAWACGPKATAAILFYLTMMVFAPIITRLLERHGFEFAALPLAYISYTWMGLIFLFFSSSLALDIGCLLLYGGNKILQFDFTGITPSNRLTFCISVLFTLVIAIYGASEALTIRTEHVTITTPKIPKSIGRLRVVQVSDIHLGIMVGKQRLQRILNRVEAAKPDILVSTGDLVDGQMDDSTHLAAMFQRISTPYGKFAVTGNHEYYVGLKRSRDFIKKAGMHLLQGEGKTVAGWLNIVGVDDSAAKRYGLMSGGTEKELLVKLPRENFTLLLKHRPLVDKDAVGLFDLQLSGHTHNGQIFPFNLITTLFYPNIQGRYSLDRNSQLYVNGGSGTWGPPIRFAAPPEITVIEIVHGPI